MTDRINKLIFGLIFVLLCSVTAFADDQDQGRPHWSLELKGGLFYPALDNWKQFYGDDKIG
jgi:hypothetical protein